MTCLSSTQCNLTTLTLASSCLALQEDFGYQTVKLELQETQSTKVIFYDDIIRKILFYGFGEQPLSSLKSAFLIFKEDRDPLNGLLIK